MAITLDGTTGITSPAGTFTGAVSGTTGTFTGALNSTNTFGFKNRIINGGMDIDQRNAGASINAVNNTYCVDRWNTNSSVGSTYYSVQRNAGSVIPPTGFTNYLGATSLSVYSVSGTDSFSLLQRIEGFNTADLSWGTANAKTVTLSAWVRSSLTGTFGGAISNGGLDRSYPFSYSIPVVNTWTQISITIAGDTSGTWDTTNTTGMFVWFSIGMGTTYSGTAGAWAAAGYRSSTGAVSVVGTSGATFYITGVQLEKGSTATSFDYRPYGTELALCQRYYYRFGTTGGTRALGFVTCPSTTGVESTLRMPVSMRSTPTLDYASGAYYTVHIATNFYTVSTWTLDGVSTSEAILMGGTSSGSATAGNSGTLYISNSSGYIGVSAEL